ncbi:MAG TPA: NlpC/P60 family protein [Acidimicrobiia bacterium]|nr:NlpC/P60 family protein [Acidimicrobiia bacterium]
MLRRSHGPFRGVAPGGRQHHKHALSLVLAVLTAAASVTLGALPASASPQSDLNSKRARARALEAQIQADQTRQEVLNEQYLAAQLAEQAAQAKIADTERQLAQTEQRATVLRQRLASRAARLYMGAGNVDFLDLNTADVTTLGSRAKYSEAAAEQDSTVLDDMTLVQEQLDRQRNELKREQQDAQARQHDADNALQALKKTTQQLEQTLSSVQGDIKQLVGQIEAAQARAEAAAARAEFARRQAQAAAAASQGGGGGGGGSVDVGPPINVPAPSAGAAAAVAYAKAQLGKPYLYAGTGPDAFDCSGLTMMAWAQGGVSMPHSSFAQADMFPRVPDNDLQPGDLSIYYGDHHHVAIYIGGGYTIAATHTGSYVLEQPVFRDGYQFSVRP